MEKIKKGDFIEIDYVGKIKEDGFIFDITDEKLAKEKNVYNKKLQYGPVIICVGEKNIIKGLDKDLEGKEVGKEYTIEVKAEDGFGKKDPKLIRLVNAGIFKKNNITPYPGLRVNIENMMGIVRTVSGGRISIDFNHPLAGKDLIYEVKIIRKIEDTKEKVNSCIKFTGLKEDLFEIKEKEPKKFVIEIKNPMIKDIKKLFEKKIKDLVPELESITINTPKQ